MKRVEVHWIDSGGDSTWRTQDEAIRIAADDDMACISCGYLVQDTPDYLLLALNQQEKRDYRKPMVGDTIQIPKVAVQSIHELRR